MAEATCAILRRGEEVATFDRQVGTGRVNASSSGVPWMRPRVSRHVVDEDVWARILDKLHARYPTSFY